MCLHQTNWDGLNHLQHCKNYHNLSWFLSSSLYHAIGGSPHCAALNFFLMKSETHINWLPHNCEIASCCLNPVYHLHNIPHKHQNQLQITFTTDTTYSHKYSWLIGLCFSFLLLHESFVLNSMWTVKHVVKKRISAQ